MVSCVFVAHFRSSSTQTKNNDGGDPLLCLFLHHRSETQVHDGAHVDCVGDKYHNHGAPLRHQ